MKSYHQIALINSWMLASSIVLLEKDIVF